MKLWQKEGNLSEKVENFTVGRDRELDIRLAPYDILGSIAHIRMLAEVDLLSREESKRLGKALRELYRTAREGGFEIEPGVEDVHSQVELLLTRKLGEAGKKIHSGRSRNDQVLLDLHLYFRDEIKSLDGLIYQLFQLLQSLADRHRDHLMPGYTHMQVAMVSSFGLWFSAFAESLTDDTRQLLAAYEIIDHNPLGSAAGYGSSFPLDRQMTTELLGFRDLCYNSIHAQLRRGKTEQALGFALASLGNTLGKMAMDICLYMGQNYGFISFPDELCTGSSIMPHKKNPDLFELVRARCNQLQSLPQQLSQLIGNLPAGYHRDFQLLKEIVFPALDHAKSCLELSIYGLSQIEVNQDILDDRERYKYLFSVDAVNELVMKDVPFRDAYRQVGKEIEKGDFQIPDTLQHTHEGSIGKLCLDEINQKMARVRNRFQFERWEEKLRELVDQGI
ncbi:MAG: argininosuccinate lyase [Saprospiraceae bacterium]|nr:argininosuccinate lyase [Saprospiraceae bacterium]